MDDPRFKHIKTDPRFKEIPKRVRKVNIDSRFKHMFSDGQFKVKYSVDKRGRKVNQTSNDDLKKYYELQENDDSEGDLPPEGSGSEGDLPPPDGDGSVDDGSPGETTDDSADDESVTDLDDNEIIHSWGEAGRADVPRGDVTSHKLALCNMDWDRIDATDIYVLANSFKPSGGSIVSVAVYPSDFGLERLSKEDVVGPAQVLDPVQGGEEDGPAYSQERLREYQLNRLKYYYAVIECGDAETAEHIYQQCDGQEYEHSGGLLDLRFIPDELTFDDREPKSLATETTLPVNFNPSLFVSSALQQSKVLLTWDETDPHRLQTTMKKFVKDDTAGMDFSAYLASSGSDSDEQDKHQDKYRALLADERQSNNQSEANEELQITWEPGLKETAKNLVEKKLATSDGATPWKKYLKEKQRKKKEKKISSQGGKELTKTNDDLGFDDVFFQHDVTVATAKSSKRGRTKLSKEEAMEKDKQQSELELLMMDTDSKQHFSLKDLLQRENEAGKKKKKKRRTEDTSTEDTFAVDVNDPRFEALYESHEFAPDPSHPQYRKTKGMEAIMDEKRVRRVKKSKVKTDKSQQSLPDMSLVSLVKSVKQKTRSINEQMKKTKKCAPIMHNL